MQGRRTDAIEVAKRRHCELVRLVSPWTRRPDHHTTPLVVRSDESVVVMISQRNDALGGGPRTLRLLAGGGTALRGVARADVRADDPPLSSLEHESGMDV